MVLDRIGVVTDDGLFPKIGCAGCQSNKEVSGKLLETTRDGSAQSPQFPFHSIMATASRAACQPGSRIRHPGLRADPPNHCGWKNDFRTPEMLQEISNSANEQTRIFREYVLDVAPVPYTQCTYVSSSVPCYKFWSTYNTSTKLLSS